jgi:co-chaperonin GroES (HSP10)
MKCPNQKIIVKANDIYNYYQEHGSISLYVDPLFKKGQRKVRVAEVVAIPEKLEDWCKIIPDVRVGDKVYFHYNALKEDNMLPDYQGLWVIDYDFIFCTVRDGQINMIGGRILAEPLFDDDIVEIEVDGFKQKAKLTQSGLVKELNPSHSLKKAKLASIGKPLIGEPAIPIQVGDVFYYIKNGDFRNEIEGKDYFVMYQEDVLAIEN